MIYGRDCSYLKYKASEMKNIIVIISEKHPCGIQNGKQLDIENNKFKSANDLRCILQLRKQN